ncbi:MAG: U32 family peptidase [Thermodesulfobacteriota bacterium]
MELTLGPVYHNWKREDILGFYNEAAEWPVDRVYIGEVVCAKRKGLSIRDIEGIGQRLMKRGKSVVLSTLALVSNEEELKLVRDVAGMPFSIEANDMSVFNMIDQKEIIAGPHINSYDLPSVEFLKGSGAKRVVFPVELSDSAIGHILSKTNIEGEVIAYGRLPVAYSWRCYTLRRLGLGRAGCRNNCNTHPEGIPVETMDREPLFTINGPQILSGPVYSLMEYVDDMREAGVDALRISPQYKGTVEVIKIFRDRIDERLSTEKAVRMLREVADLTLCNGWYKGKAGLDYLKPV